MDSVYNGSDRRRHKRVKVNFIVIYGVRKPLKIIMFVGYSEFNALMLDLSEAGMAITTNYDIPISAILLIKFTLINTYADKDNRVRSMEITGEVRNNTLLEKNEHRLGICFTQITEEDKSAITNFVKNE
jgi:c-di-GMP-binding flagellar brake protein YcgR